MNQLSVARPPAAVGMEWLKRGWALFRLWPVPWMGMTAAAFLAIFGIAMLPKVGALLVEVVSPLLVAGYMRAARAAEGGEPVTFFHLAEGARRHARPLLIIGVVYLAGGLLIGQVMEMLGGSGLRELLRMAHSPATLSPEEARALLDQSLSALLLGLLLYTPLLMATWFAPALVIFQEFSPANALWWSLWTCFVNWRPILLYSLVMGVIAALAMLIPFGLGLLVFLPWAMTSTYIAFTQQFVAGGLES